MRRPVSRSAIINLKFQTLPSLPTSRTRATALDIHMERLEREAAYTNKQPHTIRPIRLSGSVDAQQGSRVVEYYLFIDR